MGAHSQAHAVFEAGSGDGRAAVRSLVPATRESRHTTCSAWPGPLHGRWAEMKPACFLLLQQMFGFYMWRLEAVIKEKHKNKVT